MNNLVSLINFKKNKIVNTLSESIGLVVRGKKSLAIIIKSPHIFSFYKMLEKNRYVFIWAICGSVSDKRSFEIELSSFLSKFADFFSERDLNFYLLQDFIANYLKHKLYDIKSAESVSLEFILGGIFEQFMLFHTINHAGDSEPLNPEMADISLIGGGDEENRREFLDNLSKLNLKKLSAEEIIKKVGPHLRKYHGDFGALAFTIIDKKPHNKNKKNNGKRLERKRLKA